MSAGRARLSTRLMVSFGAALLALSVIEIGVRVLRPQVDAPIETPALLRGQFREPGVHPNRSGEFSVQVQVNRDRFVDREWADPQPGVPRVLVIGDSFVEAAQVDLEQGFGRVLEAAMGEQRGALVEVLSLGVPGAGTGTALALLDVYAPRLRPQLVVLGFLLSNDVLNNHPLLEPKPDKPFYRLDGGVLVPTDAQRSSSSAWRVPVLWRISHTWRLVARTVVGRQLSLQSLERGGGMPLDLRVHDPAGGSTWDEAWAVTDALVGAMAARCAEQDISFATLIFPSQVEATQAGRAAAVQAWPALEDWDLDAAGARAHAMAVQHGPVLDLTPALAAGQHDAPLYFSQDGHWTPAGHRVAAEASASFLSELLAPAR